MRKNYIKNPELKTKILSASDFQCITGLALNLLVGERLDGTYGFIQLTGQAQENIVRLYSVRDRIFCYGENGGFYEYRSGEFVLIKEALETQPIVIAIVIGGIRKIVVIGSEFCFTVDSPDQLFEQVPFGDCALIKDGRIIVGKGQTLYYGEEFNFLEGSVKVGIDGFIGTPIQEGEIVGVEVYGQETVIIKTGAIYTLVSNEQTEFGLEKFNLPYLNVHSQTVKTIGDKIIFINDGVPCVYKNRSLSVVDGIFHTVKITPNGRAARIGRNYVLPVIADGKNAFYIYDTATCKEQLIGAPSNVVCDGGYVFDAVNNTLLLIDTNGQPHGELFWKSKSFDFGYAYRKNLVEINLYTNADCVFTVCGEFGEKKFFLKKGYSITFFILLQFQMPLMDLDNTLLHQYK